MATVYLTANASWWAALPGGGIQLSVYDLDGVLPSSGLIIINSITIPIAKVKSNFPFRTNDYNDNRIQPTENDIPLSAYLNYNGMTTNIITINEYVNMVGNGDSRFDCWAPTTVDNDKSFTFSTDLIFDVSVFKSILISLFVEPLNSNNVVTLSTLGRDEYPGYVQGFNYVGKIDVSPYEEKHDPTSISIEPTIGNDNWITNTSGTLRNNDDVLKDYITKYKLSYSPSDAELTSINIATTNNLIKTSYNNSDNTITIKASNNTADYPDKTNFTVTVNGGATASTTINFYDKPHATLTTGANQVFNIGNAINKTVSISVDANKSGQIASSTMIINGILYENFFSTNYGSLLGMKSDGENKLKIENEGIWQDVTWRYYNKDVQKFNSSIGTYKSDVTTKVKYYITPNSINSFNYDFLIGNNVINNFPAEQRIILVDDKTWLLPIIGNLSYNNDTTTGGYCRGFKISLYDNNGEELQSKHINATIEGNYAKCNGNLYSYIDMSEESLPYNELISIVITAYFYFDNSSSKYYYGASHTIPNKLYRFKSENLLPVLKFPAVRNDVPYTTMQLSKVERFGYEFFSEVTTNFGQDIIEFGLEIDGTQQTTNDLKEYLSTTTLDRIVFDIGKYVEDNNLYKYRLTIKPFVIIFPNTDYSFYLYNTKSPANNNSNATINTSKETLWNRPIANQGEIIEPYDYYNFYYYINKYRYLYNHSYTNYDGTIWEVPEIEQGLLIKVDYWKNIANELNNYAINMQQKFAVNPTNFKVLWALPKFRHKKGEIINNNNLKQNFYDLLLQYSGYDSFTTHNYLKSNKYTHNALHSYTHTQITNKEL